MATRTADVRLATPAPSVPPSGANLWQRMLRYRWGYIFIAPWILIYAVFGIYPLVLSFYLTFFNYSFVRPDDLAFVGIGNWVRGILDPLFWQSTFNILYNQAIFITLTLGLGLGTALLLKGITRGGRIFRTIYFIPVVTSVIVLMTLGGYLTSATGPIQNLLVRLGILAEPIFWQSTFWLPMPIIAVINSWKWFGISTVILLAGLYSIDPQLYESASLEGANSWQLFRSITIPQLCRRSSSCWWSISSTAYRCLARSTPCSTSTAGTSTRRLRRCSTCTRKPSINPTWATPLRLACCSRRSSRSSPCFSFALCNAM